MLLGVKGCVLLASLCCATVTAQTGLSALLPALTRPCALGMNPSAASAGAGEERRVLSWGQHLNSKVQSWKLVLSDTVSLKLSAALGFDSLAGGTNLHSARGAVWFTSAYCLFF